MSEPLTAVILAAGLGSRLRPFTSERPKALVEIRGASILTRQLRALAASGAVGGAIVVVGYRAELIEAELAQIAPALKVEIVYNPFYAEVSALCSLWLGLQRRPGPFLAVNGDTFFTAESVARFLSHDDELALLYSRPFRLRPDAVKVHESAGLLAAIGKELAATEATGESAGIFRCCGSGTAAAIEASEELLREPQGRHLYWYTLLSRLVEQGDEIRLHECAPGSWFEVDDADDLATADAGCSDWAEPAAASGGRR